MIQPKSNGVVTCPTCGRRYIGDEHFWTHFNGVHYRRPDIRESHKVVRALAERGPLTRMEAPSQGHVTSLATRQVVGKLKRKASHTVKIGRVISVLYLPTHTDEEVLRAYFDANPAIEECTRAGNQKMLIPRQLRSVVDRVLSD